MPRILPRTWDEARALAHALPAALPAHPVPLADAIGRTLAADLLAGHPLPHYASSAMDGWAQ